MRSYLLLILLSQLCFTAQAVSILGKNLTTFWSQEYIGADFVRAEIALLSLNPVSVAVFDIGFEPDYINVDSDVTIPLQMNGSRKRTAHHGTSVMNLINGKVPYGVTDLAKIIRLGAGQTYGYQFYHFRKTLYPKIISNSSGWRNDAVTDLSREAYEKNTLWFLAAGNRYPGQIPSHEINSKALLVGSFAPSGLQSFNTQVHDDVVILAPANNEQATINGKGEHVVFGETSGATPLVSATMVNIAAIIPDITREQTIKLLRKSAFKSVENLLGLNKRAPLLNSYLAYKVALRIKGYCHSLDRDCISSELDNVDNYVFFAEYISCDDFMSNNELLSEMRRRALLTRSKQQLSSLACAYKKNHFEKNSEYFNMLAEGVDLKKMEKQAVEALNEGIYSIAYYKYMNHYSEEIIDAINNSALKDHRKKFLMSLIKI